MDIVVIPVFVDSDEEIEDEQLMDEMFDLINAPDGLDEAVLELAAVRPMEEVILPRNRRRRARNEDYAEVTVVAYNDDLFAEHFRMRRATFQNLLLTMGNAIGAMDNLEKNLLYTLWLLAKPESFLAAGDRFNLPKSSGHGIFKTIVYALRGLLPQFIKWPEANTYAAIANAFDERGRFPGVIGAIDGCHINIKQPQHNAVDYYNRKGVHSMILQGICDASGKFIDVFIGMPGRMHDARVFRNSDVYRHLADQADPLLPDTYHILGDSAYPLSKTLLTPYRDNGHLQPQQILYNTKLSSLRSIIERAFGRLKCKFRRLQYLDIADLELGKSIIAASCILHNFILSHEVDDGYVDVQEDLGIIQDVAEGQRNLDREGENKRSRIANNL